MLSKFSFGFVRCAVSLISAGLLLTACADEQQEKPVFTQLNELLENNASPCSQQLISVGNDLILNKAHALQMESIARYDDKGNATGVVNVGNRLMLSGIIAYNDRPAHVRFDSYQADDGQCVVSYQLGYQLDVPCMTAREEAFKRYNELGALNDKTRYYQHTRLPSKKAYLTNMNRDLQCLVSVRDTQLQTISQ